MLAIDIEPANERNLLKAITTKIDALGVDMDAFLRFLDESLGGNPCIFDRVQAAHEDQH